LINVVGILNVEDDTYWGKYFFKACDLFSVSTKLFFSEESYNIWHIIESMHISCQNHLKLLFEKCRLAVFRELWIVFNEIDEGSDTNAPFEHFQKIETSGDNISFNIIELEWTVSDNMHTKY
jgi:hypothetical protein